MNKNNSQANKPINKLAFLNPIRFILAISIVLWHCSFGTYDMERFPFFWGLREMTKYGGNQAFLLIAGMMFFLAYYPKLRSGEISTGKFLIKRALRIYPLVFITCITAYLFCVATKYTYDPNQSIALIPLLEDLFFFGSRLFGGAYGNYNGPIWFLAPLAFCYLLAVFIIFITKKKPSIWWFLIPLFVFLGLGLGSNFIVPITHLEAIGNEGFNFFLGFFFMFFLTKFENFKSWLKVTLRILGLISCSLFLAFYYKYKGDNPLGMGEMIGNFFCWIPLFTALYGLKLNFIFDNKFFKTLAGVSFHIYLWHGVISQIWSFHFKVRGQEIYDNCYGALFSFLGFVLLISFITYFLFELIRKKKWLNKLASKF